jgi:hypothetical protein
MLSDHSSCYDSCREILCSQPDYSETTPALGACFCDRSVTYANIISILILIVIIVMPDIKLYTIQGRDWV